MRDCCIARDPSGAMLFISDKVVDGAGGRTQGQDNLSLTTFEAGGTYKVSRYLGY
jgi:hypothetical protein